MAAKTKQAKQPEAPKKDLAGTPVTPSADELRREFNIALDRMANKLIKTMHVMISKEVHARSEQGQS